MYAVTVTVTLKSGTIRTFLPLILANAEASRRNEEGCHRFDVCTDPANESTVFLYELYTDRAAFDAHLSSDHFREFDEATSTMTARKDVRTFSEVSS